MKSLSIIIPVFNEEATVDTILKRVRDIRLLGWKKEIIIVDDGSRDETRKKLDAWKKQFTLISLQINQGKGFAVRQALQQAHGEFILIQDADLEYSPSDYLKLLEPFGSDKVDVVYGSRFLGPHLSTMFLYSLGNKFVTFITNILFNSNITDMETGYKVFRSSIIKKINLVSNRFDFEPEITAKILKAGHQIYEVPISYFGRKFTEGKKLTWKDGIIALWTLIKYRIVD